MWVASYLLWFIGAVLLQMTVWPTLFQSLRPDLVTVITVAVALHKGPGKGAAAGAMGGVVSDLFTGYFLGMGAITNALVGFAAGWLGPKLFKENFLVPVAIAAAATLLQQSLYWLLLLAFGRNLPLLFALEKVIGPTVIVNGLLAFPVFVLAQKLEAFVSELSS